MRFPRNSLRIGATILLVASAATISQAQVFVYRGKIDDPLTADTGRRYKEVQVGDFNEDGWPDIYACQRQTNGTGNGTNKDRVFLNQQPLNLSNLSSVLASQAQPSAFNNLMTTRGYDVEVADLDDDGNVDIVRPDVGQVDILWGDGNGIFTPTNIITDGSGVKLGGGAGGNDPNGTGNYDDVAIGDLDADGDFDILVAHYDTTGNNLLLRNRQAEGLDRTFDIELFDNAQSTHTISVADFNTDGTLDVVLAKTNGGSKLLRGDRPICDTMYNTHLNLTSPLSTDPTTVADFVDLDLDGKLDIYLARVVFGDPLDPMEEQHAVYFQSTPGGFTRFDVPVGAGDPSVYDSRYADVDQNGTMDLIRANIHFGAGSTLQAVRVNANRTYTDLTPSFFAGVEFGEMGVELADLDRDGDLDLVLAGSSENTGDPNSGHAAIHIYENTTIVLVPGENRPPTAGPDFVTTLKDTRVSIPLGAFLANDSDPDGSIHWHDYDRVTEMGGTNDCCHAGGFNYTPPPGFVGIDRMNYTIGDINGVETTGTITITVVGCPSCAQCK